MPHLFSLTTAKYIFPLHSCFVFALACSCGGGSGGSGDGDGDGGGGGGGGGSADAGYKDARVPAAECDNLPAIPAAFVFRPNVPASEDFTFDKEGNLVGVVLDQAGLTKTTYDGTQQVISPGVSVFARGTRQLPGGDFVVADPETGSLFRITKEGSRSTILSGLPDPNGVAIHTNGMVYLSHGSGEIWRINPDTAAYTRLVTATNRSFDGITFSPDYRTLYFDEEVGNVNAIPLDEDGVPTGDEAVFASIPKTEILDGMSVDACGNVYVVEMTGVIWRVDPQGEIKRAAELVEGSSSDGPGDPFGVFIPAINFGSGYGGWKAESLYAMSFGGGVFEIDIGVRGKFEPHLP